MSTHGTIVQINVSNGGVPKLPLPVATIERLGLAGDAHAQPKHHGGPERAVSLFAIERLEQLAAEGHPIAPGTTGENVTTRGIDWDQVLPGARLRLGAGCLLEITSFAVPCNTIKHNFADGEFTRMNQKLHPGWSRAYARVLVPGIIRAGDPIELIPTVQPVPAK